MALEKLRALRAARNMTYQQVADQAGISKEHYWMIENGQRRLYYDLAVKIASVFNAKPDEIFLPNELTNEEQAEAGHQI